MRRRISAKIIAMRSAFLQLFRISMAAFLFIFASHSSSAPVFSPNRITLFGDALFQNNKIILTKEFDCLPPPQRLTPPAFTRRPFRRSFGRAFYADSIRFLDSSTNTSVSFSSQFSFTITPSPSCPSGDGVAFLVVSTTRFFSLSDGYMGLPDILASQDSYFAVEFDTSWNSELGDINGDHVGIDVNTPISGASVGAISSGIDLKSGREITAWIEYRDSNKIIRVWVGYSNAKPQTPILVSQIDLSKHLKEFMHVGFSASSGKGSASYTVNHWRFKTFKGPISSTMPMDTVEKGDCLICFPGGIKPESYAADDHQSDKRGFELAVGIGGLSALSLFVLTVLAVALCVCLIKRKRHSNKRSNEIQIFKVESTKVPKRMSLAEIKSATKGFNHDKIIGEGASAIVYEGSLPSCGSVAVKRFSQMRQKFSPNPFANEFGTVVGCLKHKNLVQLQGWCCEKGELVLVYEYMPNGSLDVLLHKQNAASKLLTWEKRLKIVLGVASALIYLHEECERQIIHRDVKTCNIMLDAEFNAKLGDFGLAEVYDHGLSTRDATLPAGTMGYLAPEYVYSGIPTMKTDVYSFGVVVLEVAAGRRPVDDDGSVITDWIWGLWEKGLLIHAVDSKLIGRFDKVEMERMLMVGLSCVHPNHEKRPGMKEASRMLRGEAPLPTLPVKKPTMRIRSVLPDGYDEVLKLGEELDDTPWSTPRTHFSRN